jgi:hypothetical protein
VAFVSESLALPVSSFASEHAKACSLITQQGERNVRWVDDQSRSILYLLSRENFAHGIAFFEWLFFVDSVALRLSTSGHGGPGAPSWQLQRVSSPQPIPECDRTTLLRLIEEASRGYMTWYDKHFWEMEIWRESTLKIDSNGMKWLSSEDVRGDER